MKRTIRLLVLMMMSFAAVCVIAACGKDPSVSTEAAPHTLPVIGPGLPELSTEIVPESTEKTRESTDTSAAETESETHTTPAATEQHAETPARTTEEETELPTVIDTLIENATGFVTEGTNGYVVVIDPGHQEKGNSEQEPVGPGASQTKAKVSSGTASRFNGTPEYLVNMQVALKLRTILLERGYTVIMTRTGNAVNISNVERAEIANNANADAFVRIHCNGSENASIHGIGIYYQTPSNPYNAALHGEAKALNGCMLRHMLALTGARDDGLIESDTYSGINWCQVPAGLVEMGYMTNQEEDAKLQDDGYQQLLALGMADGIDEFLSTRAPKN